MDQQIISHTCTYICTYLYSVCMLFKATRLVGLLTSGEQSWLEREEFQELIPGHPSTEHLGRWEKASEGGWSILSGRKIFFFSGKCFNYELENLHQKSYQNLYVLQRTKYFWRKDSFTFIWWDLVSLTSMKRTTLSNGPKNFKIDSQVNTHDSVVVNIWQLRDEHFSSK